MSFSGPCNIHLLPERDVQDHVLDFTGNMMAVSCEISQLDWYGDISVGQVQTQDNQDKQGGLNLIDVLGENGTETVTRN